MDVPKDVEEQFNNVPGVPVSADKVEVSRRSSYFRGAMLATLVAVAGCGTEKPWDTGFTYEESGVDYYSGTEGYFTVYSREFTDGCDDLYGTPAFQGAGDGASPTPFEGTLVADDGTPVNGELYVFISDVTGNWAISTHNLVIGEYTVNGSGDFSNMYFGTDHVVAGDIDGPGGNDLFMVGDIRHASLLDSERVVYCDVANGTVGFLNPFSQVWDLRFYQGLKGDDQTIEEAEASLSASGNNIGHGTVHRYTMHHIPEEE